MQYEDALHLKNESKRMIMKRELIFFYTFYGEISLENRKVHQTRKSGQVYIA